jgi:uncharacterized membrane protein YphA (DoxX/SURF4 family)
MTVLAVVVARTPDPVDARMDTCLLLLIAARSRGLTTTALRGQPMVDDRRSMMTNTMHRLMQWVFHPPTDAAPPATLLIRLMAGGVFVGEGLLKFVFPATLGVGRFHALGIPPPELMATFVGLVEIVGGLLFLLGWFTRLAAIPLMIDIVVAILSTIAYSAAGVLPSSTGHARR